MSHYDKLVAAGNATDDYYYVQLLYDDRMVLPFQRIQLSVKPPKIRSGRWEEFALPVSTSIFDKVEMRKYDDCYRLSEEWKFINVSQTTWSEGSVRFLYFNGSPFFIYDRYK